jgi:hypothetical protein
LQKGGGQAIQWDEKIAFSSCRVRSLPRCSVSDTHPFHADPDPDPAKNLKADPDPACLPNVDRSGSGSGSGSGSRPLCNKVSWILVMNISTSYHIFIVQGETTSL